MKAGWKVVPLGQLCSITSGKSDTKDAVEDGRYAFFDRSRTIKRSSRFLYDCDALIIPGEGTEFLPKHFTGKFDLHQRAYALFDLAPGLNIRFLHHYLHYLSDYFPRVAVGATVKSLRRRHFEELPVALTNLPEQMRIVAILDDAFAGIDTAVANAEKNLANVRELFDSYLSSLFSRHDVGWMRRPLSTLCEKITVGHVGSMSSRYKPHGIPFLRSQNIRPFELAMENVVFIDEQFHLELKKSRLLPGDIAIVRTGYPGTAAVIPPELEDANCSDLVIIRTGAEISPHYLAAFFNSDLGKKLVVGKLVGAAQKHFNVGAAREVSLHYPSVQRQEQLVSELRGVRTETERLQSLCQRKISALGQLRQAILHKAFAGELTARSAEAVQEAAE